MSVRVERSRRTAGCRNLNYKSPGLYVGIRHVYMFVFVI